MKIVFAQITMNMMNQINRKIPMPARITRQTGFTLIEIGVAVLILSVGILGVAGMQSVGVRESQNTYFRSQANILVMDMANRMWANREQAYLGGDSEYVEDAPLNPACSFGGGSCNASDIAGMDLRNWSDAIRDSGLPNAGQSIEFVGDVLVDGVAITAVYDIAVFWDESQSDDNANDCASASGCVSWRIQI